MEKLQSENTFEAATYSKVSWRIMPILFLCYVASYLDRVNVGFAKLQMLADLNFSDTVYGLGAGIFFIGYFAFEIPSNIILHKIGARIWIARIMLTWGLVSAAMIFVSSPFMFYLMRFLLGVAEAGFFPGVILYLTYWYPAQRRGKITAVFMTAVALSGVIGGPISGWIMHGMPGTLGLNGWQWMFLIEAIPSIVLGVIVFFYLQDRVADARWLSDEEKLLLAQNIQADELGKRELRFGELMTHPRLWQMALIYFSLVMGLYGISFWLPSIIKSTGVADPLTVGLLSAIPYAVAGIGMILAGRSADRRKERRWHVIVPALLGCVGLLLSTLYGHDTVPAMIWLTVATLGILTALPLFWSLPTAFLGGSAAAAGIALINSLGNLAGFVSPYLVGWLKDLSHSTDAGMVLMAASMLLGALLTWLVPREMVNK
ncbi:D-galactonate transporter [Oxalobacteraceae bacterium GrIS 2.11]